MHPKADYFRAEAVQALLLQQRKDHEQLQKLFDDVEKWMMRKDDIHKSVWT